MEVNLFKLTDKATVPFKTHPTDFCYDIVATSKEEVSKGVYKYGTGLALQIDEPIDEATLFGITIRPRSSIYKTGMVLANGLGTLDYDYTGEIFAFFYHVKEDLPAYEVGDKIGQLHIDITTSIKFRDVDFLTSTVRGSGGFGSTGK